jgi:MYND finger
MDLQQPHVDHCQQRLLHSQTTTHSHSQLAVSSKPVGQKSGEVLTVIHVEDRSCTTMDDNGNCNLRERLEKKAEEGQFYAEEALLGMELSRDCQRLLQLLPENDDTDKHAAPLVRLLEAYYVTQGTVRIPSSGDYYRLLIPLINLNRPLEQGGSRTAPGDLVQEYRTNIQTFVEQHLSGVLVCRGFAFALWRLENADANGALLDAYCLLVYIIQLLQGKVQEFFSLELGDMLESEWCHHKHDLVDMTADDVLWCCCILLLHLGSELRRTLGPHAVDRLFSNSTNTVTNQEIAVAKLAMEIRPEAPVSFLRAYQMAMESKPLIPPPLRQSWMETAFAFVKQGLEEATQWGDPYYLYLFHAIYAYWIPTQTNPETYSHAQLQDQIEVAHYYKAECSPEVPTFRLWVGEHHEECLEYLLALHIFDKEAPTMPALVDAFWYPVPPLVDCRNSEPLAPSCRPAEKGTCHSCGNVLDGATSRTACSRCGGAEYCSTTCQMSHWKIHAAVCISTGTCGNCAKGLTQTKQLSCSKCGMVQYCNRKCQLGHWKSGHKKDCKIMSGNYVL